MPPRDATPKGLLICLSYYLPNVSGLTYSAAELARAVAARGVPVTVLTSRPAGTAEREVIDGIAVQRSKILTLIGKAPVLPWLARDAWRLMAGTGLVNIQLPNADAAVLAVVARLRGRSVVLSYISSLSRAGLVARAQRALTAVQHVIAGMLAERIVVVSEDYARQSTFCRLFWRKLDFAPLPVPQVYFEPVEPDPAAGIMPTPSVLRVGFVGRLAWQKNLLMLLEIFERLPASFDRPVELVLIGPADTIVGETDWQEVLRRCEASGGRVRHLETMDPPTLRAAYRAIDLLVLPSVDRLESFGLVQVEAMAQGVPCVAFDLPGVREPVRRTGMGRLARVGSADDFARAMIETLRHGPPRRAGNAEIRALFGPEVTCAPYLALVETHLSPAGSPRAGHPPAGSGPAPD